MYILHYIVVSHLGIEKEFVLHLLLYMIGLNT